MPTLWSFRHCEPFHPFFSVIAVTHARWDGKQEHVRTAYSRSCAILYPISMRRSEKCTPRCRLRGVQNVQRFIRQSEARTLSRRRRQRRVEEDKLSARCNVRTGRLPAITHAEASDWKTELHSRLHRQGEIHRCSQPSPTTVDKSSTKRTVVAVDKKKTRTQKTGFIFTSRRSTRLLMLPKIMAQGSL